MSPRPLKSHQLVHVLALLGHPQATVHHLKTVALHQILSQYISMLLHIVVHTKMCLRIKLFLSVPCYFPLSVSMFVLHMCVLTRWAYAYTRDIHPASENMHMKGAQIWMLKKENNTYRRESFILKQTHFTVNDMK
jgi:hypothetical protein